MSGRTFPPIRAETGSPSHPHWNLALPLPILIVVFSEKRRVPAWCDRILYFVKDKDVKLKQTQYRSHESIKFSDHKPVSTLFLAEVRTEDKAKKAQVLAELYREGDRETNKLVPSVSLSQTDVS